MARHGLSQTPEYTAWCAMRQRCHNPKCTGWRHYGGRGIRVCDEWRSPGGFERFYAHVGPKPSPEHSIDRVDNDRGYEPGNVRWATQEEQHLNRRCIKNPLLDRRSSSAGMRRRFARDSLRSSGHVLGRRAIDKLCNEIRAALEEQFGPPRAALNPADFVVEQAYWEHDYSSISYHFDGLENVYHETMAAGRVPGTHWDWGRQRYFQNIAKSEAA